MRKHLYNTKLGKLPWFIRRFGARELVLKPLRLVFAPVIVSSLPRKTFEFQGRRLDCFYHRYNMTWASERAIEIPIAKSYLDQCRHGKVLEVGNVLSHYFPVQHDIVDKFEKGHGIINADIANYATATAYDLILSISTFEHIGFDDEAESSSAQKIKEAITACQKLLKPTGTLVLTLPLGYNPELNDLIRNSQLGAAREFYLQRIGKLDWVSASRDEALTCPYKTRFPYASALLVAEFVKVG